MSIKRVSFLRLSLNCYVAILVFIGFFFSFTNQSQAKTYSTAPLDFNLQLLEQLNWTITANPTTEASSSSSQDFSLTFIPLEISRSSSLNEQLLTDYTCQKKETKTTCSLPLTAFQQPGIFRFQYSDNANFYLNFQLKQTSSQDILTTTNQLLTYGPIKTISPALHPTQLSWQEISYDALNQATASAQNLLVQYRSASSSAQAWSPWQGNFSTLEELPLNNVDSTTSAQLWPKIVLPSQTKTFLQLQFFTFTYTSIQLSYQKNGQTIISQLPQHQLSLAQPAITGSQEESAFLNTTFYLQDVSDLQVGQEIILRETVNQVTYQVQGTIIDLKTSSNLVTVNHWLGAVPLQNPDLCQNYRFCFSTQAQVALVEDFLLDLNQQAKNPLTLSHFTLQSEQPASITFLTAQLNQFEPSLCLEKNQSFCTLQALNFAFTKPPSALQYRLINFYPDTVKLENIFLHQEPLSSPATQSTFHYLRHGKTIDQSGLARPYYW